MSGRQGWSVAHPGQLEPQAPGASARQDALPLVSPEVTAALAFGRPVVALETAFLTHGLPAPHNLRVAREMVAAVGEAGATPAVVGVVHGRPQVGLADADLETLAAGPARRCSLRELAMVVVSGEHGGTTVAATLRLAWQAGIQVLATGGIGGVHRGADRDISADLPTLACTPMVVVCSGPKAILDVPRTLETLETLSVAVLGYGTDHVPAFYWRDSGLLATGRVDGPEDVAAVALARRRLGTQQALLVTVPCPVEAALDPQMGEQAAATAAAETAETDTAGWGITPEILARMAELTAGASLRANSTLLVNNARVAAEIAVALVG